MGKLCWYCFGLYVWNCCCLGCEAWLLLLIAKQLIALASEVHRFRIMTHGVCAQPLIRAVVSKVKTWLAWAASRKEAWRAWWAEGRLAPEQGKVSSLLSWRGKKQYRNKCHRHYCVGWFLQRTSLCLKHDLDPCRGYIKLISCKALCKGWLAKAFVPIKLFGCTDWVTWLLGKEKILQPDSNQDLFSKTRDMQFSVTGHLSDTLRLVISLTFTTWVLDEILPFLTQEIEVLPVLCIWLCSGEAFLLTLQDPKCSSINQVLPLAADQAAHQHQIHRRYGSQDSDQDCFREGLHSWGRLGGAVWERGWKGVVRVSHPQQCQILRE